MGYGLLAMGYELLLAETVTHDLRPIANSQ
jgi:hypothetical protein